MGAPGFFPVFGLLFIGVGIYQMITNVGKASAYDDAQRVYESKRRHILDRLHTQRPPDETG
jgi:hypothetical protein